MDHRMKVTALIADELIREVTDYSRGKNTTEAIVIALSEWLALKKLEKLNEEVSVRPLTFLPSYSATNARSLARRKRS